MPSNVHLHDIASDGRVLLSRESWRTQLIGLFPGDKNEHPYSWLDATTFTAITADGRTISFVEIGEVYSIEHDVLGYYRRTDGSDAVRIGAGQTVISPDGNWVLTFKVDNNRLMLQPVGTGESRVLPTPGLAVFFNASWSDDSKMITYEAQTEQHDWNVYVQKIAGGPPKLVKTAGRGAGPVLSADGELLALREERGGISLIRSEGGLPVTMKGVLASEHPVRFTKGDKSLLVSELTGHELLLTQVDLSSGHRELWKRFATTYRFDFDGAGIVLTPDLKYYAYTVPRYSSDLYIVENMR